MLKNINLSDAKEVKQEFILETFLPFPKNTLSMISARGGVGKTNTSLILASEYINNHDGNVGLWLTEDDIGNVKFRVTTLIDFGIIKPFNMSKVKLILEEPPYLAETIDKQFKSNIEYFNFMKEWCILNDIRLLILDPLLSFYGGNENDNAQARIFMQPFIQWCKEIDINIILIHHSSKLDNNTRGAGAFVDAVRCCYNIEMPLKEDEKTKKITQDECKSALGIRVITCTKDNRGVSSLLYEKHSSLTFEAKIVPKIDIKTNASNIISSFNFKCEEVVYEC